MQAALPDPIVGHVGDLIVADRDVRLPLHPHRPGLPVTEKYLDLLERVGGFLLGDPATVKDVVVDQDISVGTSTLVKARHEAVIADVREYVALHGHLLSSV